VLCLKYAAACCSVAVCCSVLQCVAVHRSELQSAVKSCNLLQRIAVRCSVCVCCSILQCVAVCAQGGSTVVTIVAHVSTCNRVATHCNVL